MPSKNTAKFLTAALLILAGSSAQTQAQAQDFPNKPITLVAPFPAGSVTDNVTRIVAFALQDYLGQTVIVDNRAGAQGTIGAAYVAHSKPDGYTLLVASSGMFVAKNLYKTLTYAPDSLTPVACIGATSMMFMVPQASPFKSLADVTRAVKSSGSAVTVGFGSPSGQLALALYSNTAKVNPIPVSYRGIPQALTDLAGGQISMAVVDTGSGVAQMSSGKMRPIVVSSSSRAVAAPDVPTFDEVFPGLGSFETLIGIQAPPDTPPAVVERLEKAINAAMAKPEVKARFATLNTNVLSLSTSDFTKRMKSDIPKWEALFKRAGMEPQ